MDHLAPAFEKDSIPAVFTCDDSYAKYLAVTLHSVVQNSSPNNNYDLIVFDGGIQDVTKTKIQSLIAGRDNFSIRFFDALDYLKDFDLSIFHVGQKFVVAAYFRFFIAEVLSGYDKCLYLDCDLIVNGDIAELYEINLNGHMVAAARDIGVSGLVKNHHKNLSNYVHNIIKLDDPEFYFNAGVLVMNLERMRREKIEDQLIEKLKELKTPRHFDQSVMNSLFNGDVEYIDYTFNFMWSFGGEDKSSFPPVMQHAYDNPLIVHYTTTLKPWHCKSKKLSRYFWEYAKQTPFFEEIETGYEQFLVHNRVENMKKYQQYKRMSILALGLNKRLLEKRDDYFKRLSIR